MTSNRGFTLVELAVVLAIAALLSLMGILRVQGYLDRVATNGAAAEAALLVGRARDEAIAQHAAVTLRIDSAAGTLELRARGERIALQPVGAIHGVSLSSTRDSIAFDARGLGYGAANLTLTVRRRRAVSTVVVSRLGRVRY